MTTINNIQIDKYPRTPHIQESCLQLGDSDKRFDLNKYFKNNENIQDYNIIYEEKLDGANTGFFFDSGGYIHCQSRGHLLDMKSKGGRERHYNLFKDWLECHESEFLYRFEDRFKVFGEWLYAAHSVYYDNLPHYFFEFDILDLKTRKFLSTEERKELLSGLPIVQVPVLYSGKFLGLDHLKNFVKQSLYKTDNWKNNLVSCIQKEKIDVDLNIGKIEDNFLMEGIYGKIEKNGEVLERFKFVRDGFIQKILDSDHWLSRPIIPNGLNPNVNIFEQNYSIERILK